MKGGFASALKRNTCLSCRHWGAGHAGLTGWLRLSQQGTGGGRPKFWSLRAAPHLRRLLNCASWGAFNVCFCRDFGTGGDHLKTEEEAAICHCGCRYNMITVDYSKHIQNDTDTSLIRIFWRSTNETAC